MFVQICLLLYMVIACIAAQSCPRNNLLFSRHNNEILNAAIEKIITSQNVKTPESCFGMCRNIDKCRSINVLNENNFLTCQFLSVDRFTLPMINISFSNNGIYFELTQSETCVNVEFRGSVDGAIDCLDVYRKGFYKNGIYEINVSSRKVRVLCDMTTPPHGWTVLQKRFDGSIKFYKNWESYKWGFGNLKSEFWLGNEYLHYFTKDKSNTLGIKIKWFDGITKSMSYKGLNIGHEGDKYKLSLATDSGINDGLLPKHNNQKFTTYDQDNDNYDTNCAVKYYGAWWYNGCHYSNLNGRYYPTASIPDDQEAEGITWRVNANSHSEYFISLKETEMKLRRTE